MSHSAPKSRQVLHSLYERTFLLLFFSLTTLFYLNFIVPHFAMFFFSGIRARCSSVVGPFRDIFSHDCSLACRLAIPHLQISKKVTHVLVLFDLLRSVFLLEEVADFDPGSLDFVSL